MQNIIQNVFVETIYAGVNELMSLGGLTEYRRADIVLDVVSEHAIRNVRSTPIHVDFLKNIVDLKTDDIITHCRGLFDNELMVFDTFRSLEHRARCLGLVRFLGVLYLYDILTTQNADQIALALLDVRKNSRMECYFEFVMVIHSRIGNKYIRRSDFVNGQLDKLKKLVRKSGLENLYPTTKQMLTYLAEHRVDRSHLIQGGFASDAQGVLEGFVKNYYVGFRERAVASKTRMGSLRCPWSLLGGYKKYKPY